MPKLVLSVGMGLVSSQEGETRKHFHLPLPGGSLGCSVLMSSLSKELLPSQEQAGALEVSPEHMGRLKGSRCCRGRGQSSEVGDEEALKGPSLREFSAQNQAPALRKPSLAEASRAAVMAQLFSGEGKFSSSAREFLRLPL